MKRLVYLVIPAALIAGCRNGNDDKSRGIDSATVDTSQQMPVIVPPATADSEAVVKPPPVKDNNVIMPDTTKL